MASKDDYLYDDDDDDDDEGDFEPVADDDDDLDDDFEDEDLGAGEEDSPFLQGDLYLNEDNTIVYDDSKQSSSSQSFRLVSRGVDTCNWSLKEPLLTGRVNFIGWIKDPAKELKFEICITKMDSKVAIDPFEQRFLDAQHEKQTLIDSAATGPGADLKQAARTKIDNQDDGDDIDSGGKKMASLKSPPSYSSKEAASSSEALGKASSDCGSGERAIYVLEGSQVGISEGSQMRKIRAIFHAPLSDKTNRIFLMANVQMIEARNMTLGAAGAATAAAAGGSATAVARKRGRSAQGDEDDGDEDVGYQELIDLHDDAGLSTEELRRRYYGGGDGLKSSSESLKRTKILNDAEDDDDDDDAYGF